MKSTPKVIWKTLIVGVWLVFTLSLTCWWTIFGLRQLELLSTLEHAQVHNLVRQQRMLLWEGATLILSLFLGALGLAYFMYRETQEAQRVQKFLATFTHELKTPLTNLTLQAEILMEQLSGVPQAELLTDFLSETKRLTVQLDNSLFLAQMEQGQLLPQELRISEFVENLRPAWPKLQIDLRGDAIVTADRRALECILQNLLQNSQTHGKASHIKIDCLQGSSKGATIVVSDNGVGYRGDTTRLGRLFQRSYAGSGSGIGLFLAKELLSRSKGSIRFESSEDGFTAILDLPGNLV